MGASAQIGVLTGSCLQYRGQQPGQTGKYRQVFYLPLLKKDRCRMICSGLFLVEHGL
jgi:hypothetical protein